MWLDTLTAMRKESGMSLDELSAKSGVPKGTLSKITAGITKAPALDTIKSIVYAMGYTLKDLDDGIEASDNLSVAEKEHIKKYRSLDDYGKEAVDAVLDVEYRRYKKAKTSNYIDIEAEVAAYRAELELQAEVAESSSASDGQRNIDKPKMA